MGNGKGYEIVWERDYTESGGNMRVALDASGNVVVCGVHTDEDKGIVAKYDTDGNLLWSDHSLPALYCSSTVFKNHATAIPHTIAETLFKNYGYFFDVAVDSRNNIIVAGTFTEGETKSIIYVKKYTAGGTTVWERTYTPYIVNLVSGIAVDENDDIILVGSGGAVVPPSMKGFVMKLSRIGGTVLWRKSRRKGIAVFYTSVATDSSNDILATGFTSPDEHSFDLILTKFGGRRGWRRRELIRGSRRAGMDISLDGNGDVVIAGKAEHGEEMHYLLKCHSNFDVVWEKYEIPGFLYGVAAMPNGDIAVTGYKAPLNEYYAAIHSGNSGDTMLEMLLGERVSNRLDDYMRGVAADGDNNIFITGARTVGKTFRVRITGTPSPPGPEPPEPPSPPPSHPPHESIIQKILRWLFGR